MATATATKVQDDGVVASISASDVQSDERNELNKQLDAYVTASAAEQRQWTPFREQGIRALLDDQLAGVKVRKNWGRMQLNKIFPALMQELAIHVERWQHSDVMVKARGDAEDATVDLVEGRLRWHFHQGIDIPKLMMRNVFEGKVGANYVNKVYWDEEAEWNDDEGKYLGRVKVDLLDIKQFVIDPECGYDLTKARYMGTYMRQELDWALNHWPDDKEAILRAARSEASGEAAKDMGAGRDFSRVDPTTPVTMDGDSQPGEAGGRPLEKGPTEGALAHLVLHGKMRRHPEKDDTVDKKPRFITVLEIYFLDFERDGDDNPLYPFGRMILRVGAGNDAIVLNDRAATEDEAADPQRWWMRDWPFVIGRNQILPGDTWRGLDGVVMLKHTQDVINDIVRHLEMYVRHFADPIVASERGAIPIDTRTGEQPDLQAAAGTHWKLSKDALRNKRIQRFAPPPASQGLFQILDVFLNHFNDTSGVHEVMRGARTSGKPTATEILQLQTNSRLRVGSQSWYGDRFIVALLTMVRRIELEHMDEDSEIEIIDAKGVEKSLKFTKEAIDLDYGIEMRVVTALPWDSERTQEKALALLAAFGGSPALARMVLNEFKEDLPGMDVDGVIDMMKAAARLEEEARMAELAAKAQGGEAVGEEEQPLEEAMPDEIPAPATV